MFSDNPVTLLKMVQYVWQTVPFYRSFWEECGFNPDKHFQSEQDFSNIPILTKDKLYSYDFDERVVLPATDGQYFPAISGGTTKSPTISIQGRYALPPYYQALLKKMGSPLKSVLMIRPPVNSSAFLGGSLPHYYPPGALVSMGDIRNLEATANLAREIRVDGLYVRASDAITVAPIFNAEGIDPAKIRFIWLSGEPITNAAASLIQQLYPNALVLFVYAVTEGPSAIGLRSSRCSIKSFGPGAYHVNTHDFLLESIQNKAIITARHILPTPLIRYEVGDQIQFKNQKECDCGIPNHDCIVCVGPRLQLQAYKIGGCTFRVSEITRTLNTLGGLVTDKFILRIEQVVEEKCLVTELNFTIGIYGQVTELIRESVEHTLKKELVIAGNQTLDQVLKAGRLKLKSCDFRNDLNDQVIIPPQEISAQFTNVGLGT